MTELAKKEKEEVLNISQEFVRIHGEIMTVEETIKKMEIRSSELIQELEECRAREKRFSGKLSEKYGEGKLDPMGLKWKKEEVVYETIK
jgi:predicted  nucleic acid-binding Zn-ribbon protein